MAQKPRTVAPLGKKWTARDLLDAKKPLRNTILVCLDSDYVDRSDEASRAVARAERRVGLAVTDEQRQAAALVLAEASEALEHANDAQAAVSVAFTFRALGGRVFDAMCREHKPTPAQVEEFREQTKQTGIRGAQLPYNTDTFPPALIAASCVDPLFSIEEAQELWASEDWSTGEQEQLMGAAWAVNRMVKGG